MMIILRYVMMRNQWCRGHMEGGIMKMIFELNGAITSDLKDIFTLASCCCCCFHYFHPQTQRSLVDEERSDLGRIGGIAAEKCSHRHMQIAETPYTNIVHCIEGILE